MVAATGPGTDVILFDADETAVVGLARPDWLVVPVSIGLPLALIIELKLELDDLRPGGELGRVERMEALLGLTLASPVDGLMVGRVGNENGALLGFPFTAAVNELVKDRDFGSKVDGRVPSRPVAMELVMLRPLASTRAAFWSRLGQTT